MKRRWSTVKILSIFMALLLCIGENFTMITAFASDNLVEETTMGTSLGVSAMSEGVLMGSENGLVDYVNPLIGTHNFKGNSEFAGLAPFVTSPFGMTNFTPQTRENYIGGISYLYGDTKISGFMATHQPAIWMGDYGYVNIMPQIGDVKTRKNERELPFSHDKETSTPYYYKVEMQAANDKSIVSEFTATERCAIYNFTFPTDEVSSILVEAARNRNASGQSVGGEAVVDVTNQEISGYNSDNMSSHLNNTPPQNLKGYYVIQFSKPFTAYDTYNNYNLSNDPSITTVTGKGVGAYVSFDTSDNEVVQVKIGTSFISVEQARKNLQQEIPNWDFQTTMENLRDVWNDKLNTIEIEGATEDEMFIFYTAMFHAMLYPRMFYEETDSGDKYYSPYDDQVHEGQSYTDYSLWDTFRAQNSFLTIVAPERIDSMIQSLLQNYLEGGYMPKWPNPHYTNIMIGTHADSLVAEAILKGFDGFDYNLAYDAVYKDAMVPPEGDLTTRWTDRQTGVPYEARGGLTYYKALGYVPNNFTNENVSRTVEFAYDDWCVAQVAKVVGNDEDYKFFINRSQNYKNMYDPSTNLLNGRDVNGKWGGGHYTEGDSLKYSWFAPQDPQGLIELMSSEFYVDRLETAFKNNQLEHQNEPSHHYAYMFNYGGRPDLAQKYVREVLKDNYWNDFSGEAGNDDCGQMSAWYIFSALGFYPVNPASGEYMIGSPIFDKATIHNGKTGTDFVITTNNNSDANYYIKSATLNGDSLDIPVVTYQQITEGGELSFEMDSSSSDWANSYTKEALPYYDDAISPEDDTTIGFGDPKVLQKNLAFTSTLSAPAYASKSGDIDVPSISLKDGRYDMGFWVSKSDFEENNPYYITLTWDEPQNLNQISLWSNYPKSQGPKNVDIEVSVDGISDWTPVIQNKELNWTTNGDSAEEVVVSFANQEGKMGARVKINSAMAWQWNKIAMRELEVYGGGVLGVNKKLPLPISATLLRFGNTLTKVMVGTNLLTLGTDYTISRDDIVTIKGEAFLDCITDQKVPVTFVFGSGKECSMEVYVSDEAIALTNIRIDPSSLTLETDSSETLQAIFEPETATNREITWSSSAPTVATVDSNGVVTGISVGDSIITVTAADGDKTDAITVTVMPAVKKDVTVSLGSYSLSKVYDGTISAASATGTLDVSGILSADSDVKVVATPTDYPAADVDSYSLTVDLSLTGVNSEKYQLVANSITVSAVIAPAPVAGTNQTLNVLSDKADAYTVNLDSLLPAGVNTSQVSSYTVQTGAANALFSENAVISGRTLTVSMASASAQNNAAIITIGFVSNNYTVADASVTINITEKIPVGIRGITVADRTYNGSPLTWSGTPVFYNTGDGSIITGLTAAYNWSSDSAPINAGAYTLTVSVSDAGQYAVAPLVIPVSIAKASQQLTFVRPEITQVGTEQQLSATSSSDLAVQFTSSNTAVAKIEGDILTLLAQGTSTITAQQSGDKNYTPANDIAYTITVKQPVADIARLDSLIISNGSLQPEFSPTITMYKTSVANSVVSVGIAATAKNATISGDGNHTLKVGENSIIITVTGKDGSSTEYTIIVTRQAANTNVVISSGGSGSKSSGNRVDKVDISSGISGATLKPKQAELTPNSASAKAAEAKKENKDTVTTSHNGRYVVPKGALDKLSGMSYRHDTVEGNVVKVRITIANPSAITKDLCTSGYVSGTAVQKIINHFAKWFKNKISVIHFDQTEDWGTQVKVAAKVDLTGMDLDNLKFYTFDVSKNTYRKIAISDYRIDKNGYLHFTTELAGNIFVSDGDLVKK